MHKLLVAKTNSLCASKRTSQIAHPTPIPCGIEVNFTPGRNRVNNITEIRHTPLAAATREKILTWIALKFDVGLWNINAECQQSWERWGGHQVCPRHISIFNLLRIPTWYTRHEALITSLLMCSLGRASGHQVHEAWGSHSLMCRLGRALDGRGGGQQVYPRHISIFYPLGIPTWYTRHEALIVSCAAWGMLWKGEGAGIRFTPVISLSLFSSRSQHGTRGSEALITSCADLDALWKGEGAGIRFALVISLSLFSSGSQYGPRGMRLS